jgi:hypothetical protein
MAFGGKGVPFEVTLYTDSDHGACPDSGRSTSGISLFLGKSLVLHKSKHQHLVTLSSCEAELVALSVEGCEAKWVVQVLCAEHAWIVSDTVHTYCDNKLVVVEMANLRRHVQRTRHLNIKRHFLADEVKYHGLHVRHIPGEKSPDDFFFFAF